MMHWLGSAAEAVFAFGYAGVVLALIIEGLGLPFPGDAVMAFYGFAAAEGQFHVGLVWGFSLVGYLIGTHIAYVVSRVYGRPLQARIANSTLFNARSMMRTTRLIDRYGALLLVPGRFLPGVRSVSSYVAGMTNMTLRPFFLYTLIGSVAWCAVWVGLGFWLGESIKDVIHHIQSSLTYVTAFGLAIVLAVWIVRRRTAS